MNFSRRTDWHRQPNRLSELLDAHRRHGKLIIDLTISNPTDVGIQYPTKEIFAALSNVQSLHYQPDPRGLLSARKAIALQYRSEDVVVDPNNIFLTASTSEAYSLIAKLLCNAGENILAPQPSYPLFDYLAQVNDVEIRNYRLFYDHGWHVDIDSIRKNISSNTRAIVLIHPHNPTGMFLKKHGYREIVELARQYRLALIVDEVFSKYGFMQKAERIGTTANSSDVLTFTLNGISKMLGLPQMKLGWIAVSGEQSVVKEAVERLEIACDTFLSVNTPAQIALMEFFGISTTVQSCLRQRTKANYNFIQGKLLHSSCTLLDCEGGWYGIVRLPNVKTDEEWAIEFLAASDVSVHPGYFFDFEQEGHIIVSLITEETKFQQGIDRIIAQVDAVR